MRLASMPFSVTRYSFVLTARSAASVLPFFSVLPALPTTASFASEARCRFREISSRQALPSLSTRVGRRLSRSKLTEQRALVVGAGGGGGALTVTVVIEEAVWPLSSTTLQVTVMVPGAAPAVLNVAVVVLPETDPAEA